MHTRSIGQLSECPQGVVERFVEEWRIVAVGRGAFDPQRDATPVHDRRALDALFAPVHWAPAGLLTSTRGLGDAAVYRQVAD